MPGDTEGQRTMTSIYEQLGVPRIINCATTYTRLGGSIMPPEVVAAMVEGVPAFVDMPALAIAVGDRLAELTRNEAAYVTAGAAAGLAISTAVAVAGDDPAVMARLPNKMDGLKREVIVHRTQRLWYDHAVRQTGVDLIEIGHSYETPTWELDAAFSERTAAVLYFAGRHLNRNTLDLDYVIERAHAHGVPVIVDGAAQIPPVSNLWHFTRELGADVAIFSGGKNLRGPQNSGLVVGSAEMIRRMRLLGPPNQGFARTMKVAKETMVGLLAAVERYVSMDHEAVHRDWSDVVDDWRAGWSGLPATVWREDRNEASEPIPRVLVRFGSRVERDEVIAELRRGTPPIEVVVHDPETLAVSPHLLQDGEARIVRDRMHEAVQAVIDSHHQPAMMASNLGKSV